MENIKIPLETCSAQASFESFQNIINILVLIEYIYHAELNLAIISKVFHVKHLTFDYLYIIIMKRND